MVKGGPAVRRVYFDRVLGRLAPARAALSVEYGAAVAQRNAALRRIAAGFSSREALAPWTEQVAELGAALVTGREEVVATLEPGFAAQAAAFGLDGAVLLYEGEPPTVEALEERYERDLDRGSTGLGPHLDDVAILAERIARRGQTLVTSTTAAALPTEPDQLLEVAPGRVESR